ncbi:ABC transporter ATP-binding protein [Phocaeicola barnesiae]|uniref:ABC transporter ATP-binding protein n=1 Tax=Phocaeicola barnesiae TaxID=376804 RepID=UPI00242F5A66|nr:ABC transporter ATP-binding protein [Phocaeicola barnesiae]
MDIFLEKLKKCYGSHVALNIDQYTLAGGEIVGLVGNNGAGKTTLFRLMLDLLKADDGCVRIGDIDVSHSEEWKEFTGAYLDESFLIDYLTPEEYFHFIGKICGLDAVTVDERLSAYERFMNGEILGQKKFIRNLSAGNKQKVGILAALLNRPQLLVLDEPFNFLDPSSQSALKHLLREYHQETGATILVSSHNLNHTVDISSHIILLEHGVIIRDLKNEEGNAEKELEAYFEIEQ